MLKKKLLYFMLGILLVGNLSVNYVNAANNSSSYVYDAGKDNMANNVDNNQAFESYVYSEGSVDASNTSIPVVTEAEPSFSKQIKDVGNQLWVDNRVNVFLIIGLCVALGIVMLKNNTLVKQRKR